MSSHAVADRSATYVLVHGAWHGGWCSRHELKTGHDCMVTDPQGVVRILLENA